MTYHQIMDIVCRLLGAERRRVHAAPSLVRPVVSVAERVLPHPPITKNMLDMVALDNVT